MENAHYYEVGLHWDGGRTGTLSSQILNDTIEVATPPEFDKGVAGIWSPEHLLVAAANSCLMTTFLAIAEKSRLDFFEFTSHATGKLEQVDGKYMISEITLRPVLTVLKDEDVDKASRLLFKAEANCLITESLKTHITLEPSIRLQSIYAE
ncbi:MAG: OsmC family protein [Bacteroidota bacterium]